MDKGKRRVREDAEGLAERLLNVLGRKDYIPNTASELSQKLKLPHGDEGEFERVLQRLEQTGRVARIKGNKYIRPKEADLIPGRIRMNRAGKGFLRPDDPALKEIVIPESATATALHEDRVLVRLEVPRGRFQRPGEPGTGSVVRILERRRTKIVGTLQRTNQFLYVIPDDPRMPHDVYVPEPRDVGRPARVGDKVVVELREWQSRQANPEGEIIEILGAADEEGVDMLSVLRQYELPLHFAREVLDQARAIGSEVHESELAGREDCRSHIVITIDPDDAKDFDDAICLQRVGRDQWRLWVHIADVSHYVKAGTPLDAEARKRGNSTYLVDRVIPMLPEALSNELCSLKPNVNRLTKCVEFLVSNDGRVLEAKFYPAIIHSQRRYSYQEVFRLLQEKPVDALGRMLHDANTLAQRIRKRRFQAGSLDLDFPERKIRLDEQGRVLRIEKVENDISHQLIEEFMLLANEAVATQVMAIQRPCVFRVHEEPAELRLAEYREEVLSHNVPCGDLKRRSEVQKLLQRLNELPIGQALKIGFLKSLMRARYAVEPLGHYGLAKEKYTHFTSPIRRYADLVVHRVLFEQARLSRPVIEEISEHISDTERNSADAERDSKDVKLFAFLKAQIESGNREKYAALVTDVRNFGFFVDVPELTMSGLVALSSMEDDFYIFDGQRNQLVGRRSRRIIRLGEKLTVQVEKVDSFKKQVDFRLAEGIQAEGGDTRPGRNDTRRRNTFERPSRDRRGPQERIPTSSDQSRAPWERRTGRHAAPQPGRPRPQAGGASRTGETRPSRWQDRRDSRGGAAKSGPPNRTGRRVPSEPPQMLPNRPARGRAEASGTEGGAGRKFGRALGRDDAGRPQHRAGRPHERPHRPEGSASGRAHSGGGGGQEQGSSRETRQGPPSQGRPEFRRQGPGERRLENRRQAQGQRHPQGQGQPQRDQKHGQGQRRSGQSTGQGQSQKPRQGENPKQGGGQRKHRSW